MFTRSSFFSLFVTLFLALPTFSLNTLYKRDLPPGLPADCYCNYPGCQYGIISQPYNVTTSEILGPDGTPKDNSASPGDTLVFAWDPLPCYPNNTLAIGILQGNGENLNVYNPGDSLVGPIVTNLGGRNESANGTYVFNGIGMTTGAYYQATLMSYNTTTGAPHVISGIDFTWEVPYHYKK
ncbi:hypothetical protein NEOLEDRAFT_1169430 [Neolentinus lepideus HHB14362 ss-1]|uniref:Lytic polysaccharide monooxygenase n=1 Tax=Neolentinus lepideus HHB14362 ss-1 TaxID=1314782 RepID=A0A165SR67_9AGAM|nr:hypothetical protein NEOLEDRAFT_1169430 [Neolentinus lepideus HHB14362 ss-1]